MDWITPVIIFGGTTAIATYYAYKYYRAAEEWYWESRKELASQMAAARAYWRVLDKLRADGQEATADLVKGIMEDVEAFQRDANEAYDEFRKMEGK